MRAVLPVEPQPRLPALAERAEIADGFCKHLDVPRPLAEMRKGSAEPCEVRAPPGAVVYNEARGAVGWVGLQELGGRGILPEDEIEMAEVEVVGAAEEWVHAVGTLVVRVLPMEPGPPFVQLKPRRRRD